MKDFEYQTSGTCARIINFSLDGDTVKNVSFVGGCNGNLKAISALVEGKKADDVINTLSGITCGFKSTSCGDQLATALKAALEK